MTMHPCDVVLEAYRDRALPASSVRAEHHWLKVTCDEAKEKWLRLLRPGDCEKFTAPAAFMEQHGPCFAYPLSLFGYYLGFALRAVGSKQMRTFVRHKNVASYTAFAGSQGDLPPDGVTVVIVEGYADVEAVARFHPWTVGTMGGQLKVAAFPIVAAVARKVVLLTDNDRAGERGESVEKKNFELLGRPVVAMKYPEKYKDPAEWYLGEGDRMGDAIRRNV